MTMPTSSSPRRGIPFEYLLEDEGLKSEGELHTTNATFVHEQEQTHG
jgi:hypothetical protein